MPPSNCKTFRAVAHSFMSPTFFSYLLVTGLVLLLNLELSTAVPHPWLVTVAAVVVLGWPVVVNNSVLIPRLLYHEKKKLLYWGSLVVLLLVAAGFSQGVAELLRPWLGPEPQPSNFWNDLISHTLFVFIAMSSKLTLEWFVSQRKIRALEKEKYEVELDVLKNQINPHFLFNTLNNLYGLIMQDPPRSQEVVLKLSALMRYNLYDAQKHMVPVEQEVAYIRNYMELQELRSPGVNVEDSYYVMNHAAEIPPQLLLTFVENAFKHGFGSGVRNPFVTLVLRTQDGHIHFHLANNYLPVQHEDPAHGIGLQNTRRRLKLIYRDQFDLQITKTHDTFSVDLTLPLRP